MTDPANVLSIRGLSKRFIVGGRYAVHDVSLTVEHGEIVALVGESGCGKTTLLRMIAGLETPTEGEISIGDEVMVDSRTLVPPEQRGVGMVFQDYALFPHLTVSGNVAYGLHRMRRPERGARTVEMLDLVGLGEYSDRYPHELSGGQQQRVALARALAPEPALLLLDEPFSNLDIVLKSRVREEIGEIIRRTETTALFVVHDAEDVLSIADRVAILRRGRLLQAGDPEAVYVRPRNEYVARFFGRTNVLPATARRDGFDTPIGFVPSRVANGHRGPVTVCIRPENLEVTTEGGRGIAGVVHRSTFRGIYQEIILSLRDQSGGVGYLTLHVPGERRFHVGDILHVRPKAGSVQVLGDVPEAEAEAPDVAEVDVAEGADVADADEGAEAADAADAADAAEAGESGG